MGCNEAYLGFQVSLLSALGSKFVLTWSCVSPGLGRDQCHLKYVNFETRLNHISHETLGLSREQLVVRRGKPFRLTLMFDGRSWNPRAEILGLRVWLGTRYHTLPQTRLQEWNAPTLRLQMIFWKATATLFTVRCSQKITTNLDNELWFEWSDV